MNPTEPATDGSATYMVDIGSFAAGQFLQGSRQVPDAPRHAYQPAHVVLTRRAEALGFLVLQFLQIPEQRDHLIGKKVVAQAPVTTFQQTLRLCQPGFVG